MNNSIWLDTPNSKYYALRTKHSVQHELGKNSSSHNTSTYTTDGELSITEHCQM